MFFSRADVPRGSPVDSAAATRIASALETGTITLVRATGAPPLREATPFDPAAGESTVATPR